MLVYVSLHSSLNEKTQTRQINGSASSLRATNNISLDRPMLHVATVWGTVF